MKTTLTLLAALLLAPLAAILLHHCVLHNVRVAQAFVPAMIAKQWGRVIAINTECAMQNHPDQSAYVSGKRGMDGVLPCLGRDVGEHGITVNQARPAAHRKVQLMALVDAGRPFAPCRVTAVEAAGQEHEVEIVDHVPGGRLRSSKYLERSFMDGDVPVSLFWHLEDDACFAHQMKGERHQ